MKIRDIINMKGKYSAHDVGECDIGFGEIIDKMEDLDEKVMNLTKSVANLLIEKDKFKELWQESREVLDYIHTRMYNIGGPLNDNILKFDNKQLKWLIDIAENIKHVL